MSKKEEHWGSRIGVILAVAGSAVGLGNLLRFPGQAAQHGGGAFMIPYFISLVVLGIPICWAEWTMGRYGGTYGFHSAPAIFSVLWPRRISKYLGGIAVIVPLVIYMYYVVIEAWCLGYAYFYLTGALDLGSNSHQYVDFFRNFVGSEDDGFLYESGRGGVIWFVLIAFALNFLLVYRGISKGIEKFCMFALPTMAVIGLCALVRVLTLGTPDPSAPERSVSAGLGFMWNPDFSYLLDPRTWLAASGQIFFSLSVGFGIVINYASYLRRHDDVSLSALTSSSLNEFFEVTLGGLITLPAAFIFLGLSAGTLGTFALGFHALPNVFALMPGGQFFGFAWFFLLFLAAITSSLAMLQPVSAFLEEGFGVTRAKALILLAPVTLAGSAFVIFFSKGLVALDTFDFWVGTTLIFLLGTIQVLIYGWAFGIKKGEKEMNEGGIIRVPSIVQILLKYVSPAYLTAIFVGFCYTNFPEQLAVIGKSRAAIYSLGFIAVVIVATLVLVHFAGKRWKKEERWHLAHRRTAQ